MISWIKNVLPFKRGYERPQLFSHLENMGFISVDVRSSHTIFISPHGKFEVAIPKDRKTLKFLVLDMKSHYNELVMPTELAFPVLKDLLVQEVFDV